MLDDLAVLVEAEDVDACPVLVLVSGPHLVTMENDAVALCDRAFEVHAFARLRLGHALEIVDKGLLPICDVRVVLGVGVPHIALHRFRWLALIKHQIIERHRVLSVAFESVIHLQISGHFHRRRQPRLPLTPNAKSRGAALLPRPPRTPCRALDSIATPAATLTRIIGMRITRSNMVIAVAKISRPSMKAQCAIYFFFETTTANYGKAQCSNGHTQPKPNHPKPVMAEHYIAYPDNEERETKIITRAHMNVPNV